MVAVCNKLKRLDVTRLVKKQQGTTTKVNSLGAINPRTTNRTVSRRVLDPRLVGRDRELRVRADTRKITLRWPTRSDLLCQIGNVYM